MSAPLRLVIFDVDGTLVDSQAEILAAMEAAFAGAALPIPAREAVLSIVGLSLGVAMQRLAPTAPDPVQVAMVAAYKTAYAAVRGQSRAPLYPGTADMLTTLCAVPDLLLGVATGKSMRGLRAILGAHGLERRFVTLQTADHHPSKPNPAMIEAALAETGVEARNAVMIGDTEFDMQMARAAGVAAVGVGWGYHPRARLAAADAVIDRWSDLPTALAGLPERR